MFETDDNAGLTQLSDRLNDLSTRLIIDGPASLEAADFDALSAAALEQGRSALATAAKSLAGQMTPPVALSKPDLTRMISAALVEFRRLLERAELSAAVVAVAASLEPRQAPEPEKTPEPAFAPAAQDFMLGADQDLLREFITESGEHLVTIEGHMLALEKDATASEPLNAVFRAFHTIKGLAGLLQLSDIQALTHEVETLLDKARTQQLTITSFVVDVILDSSDIVRGELNGIEARLAGQPAPATGVNEALLARIRSAARGEETVAEASAPAAIAAPAAKSGPVAVPSPVASPAALKTAERAGSAVAKVDAGVVVGPPQTERRVGDASSLRIETGKLDQLMDTVGEMVIAQTLISHSPSLASISDPKLLADLGQLARITADVQRITTGMRMVPIGIQFQKSSRVVRDLSRRAGKQIVVETSGEDTELDKSIAEELSDPLLHMVRNSIDHGIEPPDERIRLGKDPTAHIRIAAYHQSGQIVVEISDDGRGLNRERILAKALQNGIIQKGAQLSDNDIFHLIFEPGFSTAEKITDISGRGVGMDVVRKHVQKMRGRIDIVSKEGEGTTFYIKLPLTLAIIEGLVVAVGDQRYIVPIFAVREMFRPQPEAVSTVQGSGELAMVRGGLMPITRLHRFFDRPPRTSTLTEGTLIVAESEGRPFCLFVDDLIGKQEVVIKSLGPAFRNLVGIAGCAILGDGRVGLILDIDGIYKGRAA